MAATRIVLASGSKQRLALLTQIGITPIVKVSNFEEGLSKSLPVVEFVEQTAKGKAMSVAQIMDERDFDYIIGCDTVVTIDGEIIGKPKDKDDALTTLKRLNGRVHQVYSGVALIDSKMQCEVFHERTEVKFCNIPDEVLESYVNSGEPLGRAGSYGIQKKGALFVEKIDGCYYNVVGLPLNKLVQKLWKKVNFFTNN